MRANQFGIRGSSMKPYGIKKAHRELSKINQIMMDRHPFWAIHAHKVTPVFSDLYRGKDVDTAVIDGEYLTINPTYWMSLISDVKNSLYAHEIGHIGLGHHLRRDDRDFKKWNESCDFELNLLLEQQGYSIPETWLIDRKFKGWSAERIYTHRELEEKGEEEDEENGFCEKQGNREDRGDADSPEPGIKDGTGECTSEGEIIEEDGEVEEVLVDDTGGVADGGVSGGGEVDEADKTSEKESDNGAGNLETESKTEEKVAPNPSGEVWDPTNQDGSKPSKSDIAERLDKLSQDIQMIEAATKACGNSPDATSKRAFNRIVKPNKNWKNILELWITEKGSPCGRSWSKMDRRSMTNRIYQPGVVKDGISWLVFAVDVSGSIMEREYRAFASHIDDIRKNIKVDRITFLPFNTDIVTENIKELKQADDTPKEILSGGGTSFAPIFNWVRKNPTEPEGIIVFTDLCCNSYGIPTRSPVLWASTDEIYDSSVSKYYSNTPPFGEAIQIDISQK